jgi:hypothetical protein
VAPVYWPAGTPVKVPRKALSGWRRTKSITG